MEDTASIDASSSDFWESFVPSYWQKKATVFKNAKTPLDWGNESSFFNLLIEYFERSYHSPIGPQQKNKIVVTIRGEQINGDISPYLPLKSDSSLQAYHRRMLELSDSNYSLYLTNFYTANFQLWHAQREFVHGLQQCVGLPSAGIGSDVFMGHYPQTAFGVHCDPMDVFYTPVLGKKRYRIWDKEYVSKHPEIVGKTEYQEHLEQSIIIEGEPGDLIYWPSRSFHIAEGTHELTVAMGTFYDLRQSTEMLSFNCLYSAMERTGKVPPARIIHPDSKISFDPTQPTESASKPPPELEKSRESLINLLQSPQYRDAEKIFWQKTVSTSGLNISAPLNKQSSFAPSSTIQVNPKYPILGTLLESDKVYCIFANGYVHQTVPHPFIHALIMELNKGDVHQIQPLTEQFSGSFEFQGQQLDLAPEIVANLLNFIIMANGAQITS